MLKNAWNSIPKMQQLEVRIIIRYFISLKELRVHFATMDFMVTQAQVYFRTHE